MKVAGLILSVVIGIQIGFVASDKFKAYFVSSQQETQYQKIIKNLRPSDKNTHSQDILDENGVPEYNHCKVCAIGVYLPRESSKDVRCTHCGKEPKKD